MFDKIIKYLKSIHRNELSVFGELLDLLDDQDMDIFISDIDRYKKDKLITVVAYKPVSIDDISILEGSTLVQYSDRYWNTIDKYSEYNFNIIFDIDNIVEYFKL